MAEEITVFRCDTKLSPARDGHKDVERGCYTSAGERLGKFDTGDKTLISIIKRYRADSWKSEPFYGPVKEYVFRDSKDRIFLVHFEYMKGHKNFGKGFRFAVIQLTKDAKGRYIGSPYDGSSVYDETILKHLREFARKDDAKDAAKKIRAEQEHGERRLTRTESKDES